MNSCSQEDKLREACACGEEDKVRVLLSEGVDVNHKHAINGWTALHWAAKRGFPGIVQQLLEAGADSSLETAKGEVAVQLTDSEAVAALFGGRGDQTPLKTKTTTLPITANYLSHPKFPYLSDSGDVKGSELRNSMNRCQDVSRFLQQRGTYSSNHTGVANSDENELVLKVRIANHVETDYIEIELDRDNLTYEDLVTTLCEELNVERSLVYKIRKQPDTIVRKDKDVQRLIDFQELELVLTNKAISSSSRGYAQPKEETILY